MQNNTNKYNYFVKVVTLHQLSNTKNTPIIKSFYSMFKHNSIKILPIITVLVVLSNYMNV